LRRCKGYERRLFDLLSGIGIKGHPPCGVLVLSCRFLDMLGEGMTFDERRVHIRGLKGHF
jgi:hypothetical protein